MQVLGCTGRFIRTTKNHNGGKAYYSDKILVSHLIYWDIVNKTGNNGSGAGLLSEVNLLLKHIA